jgi:L-ascorbate metabolism protein UlaG (beta-lactamase superfamily)
MRVLNISLRRKAKQFGKVVRHSLVTKRTGTPQALVHAASGELGITFIGHSGFLIQIGGKNVLVDPNFANWIFILKRLRRPGLRLRELPPIDYVLVSHAHFDHLHRPSLRAIARLTRRKRGLAPQIIVPRHVGEVVESLGYSRVLEMEWWQTVRDNRDGVGGLEITHTPANHWGARMIHDNHRGFGGFVLRAGEHSVYHSGDTAYFGGFAEIGRRLRPGIALLPIGAYEPPSFRNVHTSPEDALQGFLDLRAERMIPMHYGTFRLSHEPMEEPVPRLIAAAEAIGIKDRVTVLREGETLIEPVHRKQQAS